jgi:large subunit ribosomal protein L29
MSGARKRGTDSESLREMSPEDLQARLDQLQEEQFRLRFRSATMPLENPMLVRNIRRDIARIRTALRQRELSR